MKMKIKAEKLDFDDARQKKTGACPVKIRSAKWNGSNAGLSLQWATAMDGVANDGFAHHGIMLRTTCFKYAVL